ncbi:MAG: hypothetical protein IT328_11635 [Caldilineaceae bacterium]|nr:hypothetical protein [Caldilineaceae bacterium]
MELLSDLVREFLNGISNYEDYRAGFLMGLTCAAGLLLLWLAGVSLYKRWLKMRQFFEPIKKPGKIPVETGPSPAGMLLGCLWPIAIIFVMIALWVVSRFGGIPGS